MTQFKEKSRKEVRIHFDILMLYTYKDPVYWFHFGHFFLNWQGGENASVSLLTYPVLMAADILLYKVML